MKLEFLETQKEAPMFLLNGYLYQIWKKNIDGTVRWRCREARIGQKRANASAQQQLRRTVSALPLHGYFIKGQRVACILHDAILTTCSWLKNWPKFYQLLLIINFFLN